MKKDLRQNAIVDLYFFAKGILGFDWLDEDIHLPICQILENYGKNTRVKIVLPRSWLKSTLASIAYPMWRMIKNPNIRVLIVQNSATNATKKLAVIRGKFETCGLFRALFPEFLPDSSCTWTSTALCIPRSIQSAESTFETAGTRTKVVSRHYDIIIEDDTVAPDLDDLKDGIILPSKEDVEQAIGWHRLALPLLTDPLTSQILIVGTRWFERDLISWNNENEPHYKTCQRAVRETNGIADEGGEIVWKRFSEPVLKELENALGPYTYSCLYMNKPIRSSDMVFQPEWFKYYDNTPRDIITYTTVDLAGDPNESKGDPDYNVVLTAAKDLVNGNIYVLDYFRARCNPSELIQALFEHVRRFKPIRVGIESVAYQKSLLHWVRTRMRDENLYFSIEPLTHGKRNKNSRIIGLQPLVKSGMLMFKTFQRELTSELTAFPFAKYDDVSDALSMQIPMWSLTKSKREEEKRDPANDPMSFDSALKEIERRKSKEYICADAYSNVTFN